MSRKKKPVPQSPKLKEKTSGEFRLFDGDLFQGKEDLDLLRRAGREGKRRLRWARYWCYLKRKQVEQANALAKSMLSGASQSEQDAIRQISVDMAPDGFYDFVEALPGFRGWETFSGTWDIVGENPFAVVFRLISVQRQWEQVMDRVAIPVTASQEEVELRMKVLQQEYRRG